MRLRARIWPGLRTRGIVLEVVLAVLSTVAISAGAATGDRGPVSVAVFAVLATVVFVLTLTLRRRAPFVPFLLGALAVAAVPGDQRRADGSRLRGRPLRRPLVRPGSPRRSTGVLVVARPWDGGPAGEQVSRWLGGAVLVLLPGAVGIYVRTRAQLLAALRERAERAEAERELLARDAVLTERTRIAREMHDAVGHRVSLMVLQAGAIEMAAADPDRVQELAGQRADRRPPGARRAAPDGRRPARREATRTRRSARSRVWTTCPRLVEQARDAGHGRGAAGGELRRGRPGRRPRRLPDRAGGADQRRQARARGARSASPSSGRPGELVVRVVNGAGGRRRRRSSGGFGLVGLAERVRTLGGRLTAEPRLDGGFVVEAVLPA